MSPPLDNPDSSGPEADRPRPSRARKQRHLRTIAGAAVLASLLAAVCGVALGAQGTPPPPPAPAESPSASVTVAPKPEQKPSSDVHIFYYPWYGGSDTRPAYRHWTQGGHTPVQDIGVNLYPALGAYDSGDFAKVVPQHMSWIRQSGAGVLVYSWWGRGSQEDKIAAKVLDAAAAEGLKVAWHVESYKGRTADSTVSDIQYINSTYGRSPAFYRDAEHGDKGAFYVFESLRIADWTPLDRVKSDSIVLAQTTSTAGMAHFGGAYTYDGIAGATAPGWKQAADYCRAHGLVWAPSVAPGYIDDRAVPANTTPTLGRAAGSTYDKEWINALNGTTGGLPDWVSITSFNEWHEGSVIEPASSSPPAGHGYQTFAGAYGRTGKAAESAYIERTRHWVTQFQDRRGPSQPPVQTPAQSSSPAPAHGAAGAGTPRDPNIAFVGRWNTDSASGYTPNWAGSYFQTAFTGTTVRLQQRRRVKLFAGIDGGPLSAFTGQGTINLTPRSLSPGKHTLKVTYASGDTVFQRLGFDPGAGTTAAAVPEKLVEFIGDSITVGYLTSKETVSSSSWVLGERLGVRHTTVARTGYCLVARNSCIGQRELYFRLGSDVGAPTWDFSRYQADAVVVNLGTNDANQGLPGPAFQEAYTAFLTGIRAKYPKAAIVVLETFRKAYSAETRAAVQARRSAGDTRVRFVPTGGWLTAPVDFTDGVHPNDNGQIKIADRLASVVAPLIGMPLSP